MAHTKSPQKKATLLDGHSAYIIFQISLDHSHTIIIALPLLVNRKKIRINYEAGFEVYYFAIFPVYFKLST